MSHYHELEQLADEVRQRLAQDELYAEQWQRGYEKKRERRIQEIIIDVVRSYYGRVINEVVRQLHRLLSLD
jgi:hypothetical protein